jgi:hypothetical protein
MEPASVGTGFCRHIGGIEVVFEDHRNAVQFLHAPTVDKFPIELTRPLHGVRVDVDDRIEPAWLIIGFDAFQVDAGQLLATDAPRSQGLPRLLDTELDDIETGFGSDLLSG